MKEREIETFLSSSKVVLQVDMKEVFYIFIEESKE